MKLGCVLVGGLALLACGTEPAKAPEPVGPLAGMPTDAAAPPAEAAAPAKPAADANAASVEPAKAAAQTWLALVDETKYADTWSTAAKGFQSGVSAQDWANAVAGVRQPLGKLLSRKLQSAEYKTSLPGAPDGKYVVIQFNTVFEHKARAVETVTPTQEPDGNWKVSGYFIK